MSKFLRILLEITYEAFYNAVNFVCNNMMNFANILNLLLPFIMYFMGQKVANGKFHIGPEIIIPIVFFVIIYYAKNMANKLGKGITIPVPKKRFTEEGDEGEVSVENNRLQEMLLYMADLEDWLERKGLL